MIEDNSQALHEINSNDDDDQQAVKSDQESERQPLLFVDINLGGDEQERIVVYEGDTSQKLAQEFCLEHNLDDET